MLNLAFGWVWITMGFLSGAVLGMGFHREEFMGGYGSWARRMARLGHIAFFGTGFLNLMLAFTWMAVGDSVEIGGITRELINAMFIVGAIGMPLCCFAAARWKRLRHAFVVPVVALTIGSSMLCLALLDHPEVVGLFTGGAA
jgi:hypothetical protein